jgi:hypothetical protein
LDLRQDIEVALRSVADEGTGTAGGVSALRGELQAEISAGVAEAEAQANQDLSLTRDALNARMGAISTVKTPDSTPVVLATVSPELNTSVKIMAEVVAHRTDRLEAAIYQVLALARAIPSNDVLTFSVDAPSDGEQVVLGTETYTWRTAITPSTPNEVLIGTGGSAAARMEASIDNLVKAINLTGTDDVEYGAGTAKNASASAVKASVVTLEAVARVPGVAGDAIVTTETMTNGAWAGGGTMGSGSDMSLLGDAVTVEYEDDAGWDVAIAVNGSDIEISVTGVDDTDIEWKADVKTLNLLRS